MSPLRAARIKGLLERRSTLRIVVLGAGVQGTVFAVRLALAGHQVTLVSRPERAIELRREGAAIQDLKNMRICTKTLPVLERLPPDIPAELCLVTVRREQIETVLPDLVQAIAIPRIAFLVNHANGSADLSPLLGRSRTVLAFPGIAGDRAGTIIRYLDIPQQHTVVEERARDVISLSVKLVFLWMPCETWTLGYSAMLSSSPRSREHFMRTTAMHFVLRKILKW
jgi:NAD(P)-dependent dehydrogenase (short-subunit alcohol dehydrogenase family)